MTKRHPADSHRQSQANKAQKRELIRRLIGIKSRRSQFETLEERQLMAVLSDPERASLREAFQAVAAFTANMQQSPALNTNIPVLEKKLSDVVNVDQILRERFLGPVNQFLSTATASTEDLQRLFQTGIVGISSGPLGKMPTAPTQIAGSSFSASFDIDVLKTLPVEYDLQGQLGQAGVETNIGKSTANLNFEMHLGATIDIDLTKIGAAPNDIVKVTLRDGTNANGSRVAAKVQQSLGDFEASAGIGGGNVTAGTLDVNLGLPMDFGGSNTSQAFKLAELRTTADGQGTAFRIATNASAVKNLRLGLPFTIDFGATRIADKKSIVIQDNDLYDGAYDLAKTGPLETDTSVFLVVPTELAGIRQVSNSALFGVMDRLGAYFSDITNSPSFQTVVPFTDSSKLGDLLNLKQAFESKLVNPARQTNANTSGQQVNNGTQNADDVRNVGFKNAQDLARRLGSTVSYIPDLELDNDPATKQPGLKFEIDFTHASNVATGNLNFDTALGDLAKLNVTKSSLSVSATVDAQLDATLLLERPGSSESDKIADAAGNFLDRPMSFLNAGNGAILTGPGKDLLVTLTDGTRFEVELDTPIYPITSNPQAQVIQDANGDLTNEVKFLANVDLTQVKPGMILSLINRTDGKDRTDRFDIKVVKGASLIVEPTPTAGADSYNWAIDLPPQTFGDVVSRFNQAGAAAAGKFSLSPNSDRTGFRIIDKTVVTVPNAGTDGFKIEDLGSSKASISLGIGGAGTAANDGDPVMIEGTPLHGRTLQDNFFLNNVQIDAGANLIANINNATTSIGMLGVNIANGSGTIRQSASLSLQDPGPKYDGRISLTEGSTAIRELVDKLSGQKAVAFPTTPNGTLNVTVRGKDNELSVGIGGIATPEQLVNALNANVEFAKVATGSFSPIVQSSNPGSTSLNIAANNAVLSLRNNLPDASLAKIEVGDFIDLPGTKGGINDSLFRINQVDFVNKTITLQSAPTLAANNVAWSIKRIAVAMKTSGVSAADVLARRLTIQTSAVLGLARNETSSSSLSLKPAVFPLSPSGKLSLTVSQDNVNGTYPISFAGATEYYDIESLLADVRQKLVGTPLIATNIGGLLSLQLNNGRARFVDTGVFAALGFTTAQSAYLIRPKVQGQADFDLPFTMESNTPVSSIPSSSRIAL